MIRLTLLPSEGSLTRLCKKGKDAWGCYYRHYRLEVAMRTHKDEDDAPEAAQEVQEMAVSHERMPELDRATTEHEASTGGTEPMRVVLAPPQAPSATQLTNQQVARRIPCGARS